MKICFVTSDYPKLGARQGEFARTLTQSIVQQGYQVDVITSASEHVETFSKSSSLEIHKMIQDRFLPDSVMISQFLLRSRPALVHLHLSRSFQAQQVALSLAVAAGAQMIGAPLLTTVCQEAVSGKIASGLIQPVLAQSRVAFVPHSLYQKFKPAPRQTRVLFQSSLYDPYPPSDSEGASPARQTIALHSQMRKRPAFFIELLRSLARLSTRHENLSYLGLFGFENKPALMRHLVYAEIQRLGMAEKIRFLGTDDFVERRQALSACEGIIFADETPLDEWTPDLLGAALKMGCPSLIRVNTPEALNDLGLDTGLFSLFPPKSHRIPVSQSVEDFISSLAGLRRKARDTIQPVWTIDHIANNLARHYSRLVG